MQVREMVLTYRPVPRTIRVDGCQPLTTPRAVSAVACELLSAEVVEVFGILCLTTKHQLLAWYEVSRGSLDTTVVHPRDVFKAALLANAAGIVLAHNHPSGDATPSSDDRVLTTRLVDAGLLIGIDVLDHIVVGHQRYFSFREAGMLQGRQGSACP